VSAEWGLDVRPLLQAVDTTIFRPRQDATLPGSDAGVVFVGQARTTGPRQIVMDAVAAGLRPKVWGGEWETHIPSELIQATSVPYTELPRLYQGASVVLCDHYPDMAREGFIANRVFDAVACGARVVSDDVAGLDELFGGAVQVASGPADLARLVSAEGLASFPSAPELAAIAERVVREHSYEVRARTLVRDVVERFGSDDPRQR
jgi:spore maturation protein CgeB